MDRRNSSFEFSFDNWVSLNHLDPQLCQILINQKLDSVAAILGLQEEDCQELFQGLPTGLRTSFRYAKNSLAATVSSYGSISDERKSAIVATPPDPACSSPDVAPKQTRPERPPRRSLTPALSSGTLPHKSNVPLIAEKPSSLPKDGVNVKKLAGKLDIFYKHQILKPLEESSNNDKSLNVQNKISKSPSFTELPLLQPKPTPPPIPKRPDNNLLVKILNSQVSTTTRSLTGSFNLNHDDSDDNGSLMDDSVIDSEYSACRGLDEESEYYDVPPMLSPQEASENTMAFKTDLEKMFQLKRTSRSSADSAPLYQHYEEFSIKRNRTFESMDRRSETGTVNSKTQPPVLQKKRTIWSELPKVIECNVLDSMSEDQIHCKEATFEIITSQVCFVRSLSIATTFFVQCPMLSGQPHLGSCIDMQERKALFSNVTEIKDINDELLEELEAHLEGNYLLPGVIEIVDRHIRKHSKLYVQYCSNQIYQERMLSYLKSSNVQFQNVMAILEGSKHCENLDLRSFLLSPMQRVTRYPLLLNSVLTRTKEGTEEFIFMQKTLSLANQMANDCNETARKFERIEQLVELDKKFVYQSFDAHTSRGHNILQAFPTLFPVSVIKFLLNNPLVELFLQSSSPKRIALTNSDRWLLKQNLTTEICSTNGRIQNRPLFVYLFTDMFIITKPQKSMKQFLVLDYCLRPFVEMISVDINDRTQWPTGYQMTIDDHMLSCVFLKNVEQKKKNYFLKFDTETDKIRWLNAYKPSEDEDEADKVYDRNDCPQVEAIVEYRPSQEDELGLKMGDVVNVLKKMSDGWYQGERLRDHAIGWFPSFHVKSINNHHEEAKTIRERQKMVKNTRQMLSNMKWDN